MKLNSLQIKFTSSLGAFFRNSLRNKSRPGVLLFFRWEIIVWISSRVNSRFKISVSFSSKPSGGGGSLGSWLAWFNCLKCSRKVCRVILEAVLLLSIEFCKSSQYSLLLFFFSWRILVFRASKYCFCFALLYQISWTPWLSYCILTLPLFVLIGFYGFYIRFWPYKIPHPPMAFLGGVY